MIILLNKITVIEDTCPSKFKKISEKKKCIDICINDRDYIFEYSDECFMHCPENLKTDDETKTCLKSCHSNQFEYENICYYNLTGDFRKFFQNGNILFNQF